MTMTATMTAQVDEQQLNDLRALIEERSGIRLDESRERFFRNSVQEHIQTQGLADGARLKPLVCSSNVEYEAFLQCFLTHETSFFRYPSAFQALQRMVLPEVQAKKMWASPRTLRIWSAGCSTGEEPYSIALAIAETPAFNNGWEIEILATDVSRKAVAFATEGVYTPRSFGNVPVDKIRTYFNPNGRQIEVKPALRKNIKFHVMNLVQCPYLGKMDCIFCMNVLIYFAGEKREQVIRNFYDSLEPGGYLMLGHSESLGPLGANFEKIVYGDFLLYKKPAESRPWSSGS